MDRQVAATLFSRRLMDEVDGRNNYCFVLERPPQTIQSSTIQLQLRFLVSPSSRLTTFRSYSLTVPVPSRAPHINSWANDGNIIIQSYLQSPRYNLASWTNQLVPSPAEKFLRAGWKGFLVHPPGVQFFTFKNKNSSSSAPYEVQKNILLLQFYAQPFSALSTIPPPRFTIT